MCVKNTSRAAHACNRTKRPTVIVSFSDLSENYLAILTRTQMEGLSRLKNLQLDKNFLTCIDDEVLHDQTEMEILT